MRIEWERVNALVCTVYGSLARPEVRFVVCGDENPRFIVRIEKKRFREDMGKIDDDLIIAADSYESALNTAKACSEKPEV